MRIVEILAFLPPETVVLMIVLGGMALILQLKGIAKTLFFMAGLMIFLPMVIEPALDMLPDWAFPFLEVFLWFSILGSLITLLIGKNAKDHMVGILAADFIKWLLFRPFVLITRLVGWLRP